MTAERRPTSKVTRLIVVAMVVGAVVFGLVLGYLAFQNQSFPSAMKPFDDYASVVSSTFNGTEYYFKVEWTTAGNFTPLYAQLTSSTDSANSPVCGLGIDKVQKGQTFELPFGTASPSTALSNVDLFVAVRANSNMTEFTIQYHVDQVTAQPGNISSSGFLCTEPNTPL